MGFISDFCMISIIAITDYNSLDISKPCSPYYRNERESNSNSFRSADGRRSNVDDNFSNNSSITNSNSNLGYNSDNNSNSKIGSSSINSSNTNEFESKRGSYNNNDAINNISNNNNNNLNNSSTNLGSRSNNFNSNNNNTNINLSNSNKRYDDNLQIFVGNLPPELEKETLKRILIEHFGQAGKIQEVRINASTQKAGTGASASFAFVVFEKSEVPNRILNSVEHWRYMQVPNRAGKLMMNIETKKGRDESKFYKGYGSGQGGIFEGGKR